MGGAARRSCSQCNNVPSPASLRAVGPKGTTSCGTCRAYQLDRDYFDRCEVPDERIKDIESVLTVVHGRIVHNELERKRKKYWNRHWREEHRGRPPRAAAARRNKAEITNAHREKPKIPRAPGPQHAGGAGVRTPGGGEADGRSVSTPRRGRICH